MKKTTLLFVVLLYALATFSQPPQGFTYQAVLHDNDGQPLSNQAVGIMVSLMNETGTTTYFAETHTPTTSPAGVVSLVVGMGEPSSGDFASVPWESGEVYISLAVDPSGGTSYESLGLAKLMSVPFALHAGGSEPALSGEGTPGQIAFWSGTSTLSGLTALSYDSSLEVTSPTAAGDDDPIFEVKNRDGKVVFGVYQTGVRVYVDDTQLKGTRGGFAVGGLSDQGKQDETEFLRVTPDSVRISFKNPTTGGKGARGGFAVGGLSDQGKSIPTNLLFLAPDSARVYVNPTSGKGARGGFAVGGLSDQGKTIADNFLNLTPDNYFIGHRAGESITNGLYNTFLGYEAGLKSEMGNGNIFLGYGSGHENVYGALNVFIGNNTGYYFTGEEDGEENIFIGNTAGYNSISPANSIFIGTRSGYACTHSYANTFVGDRTASFGNAGIENTLIGASAGFSITGENNVIVGSRAGSAIGAGSNNSFLGYSTGSSTSGSFNVFIGSNAGDNEPNSYRLHIASSADESLIYGEFDNRLVVINGHLEATDGYSKASDINLKTNLVKLNESLSKIQTLTAYRYTWNEQAKTDFNFSDKPQIGLIAQEVEKVLPELVLESANGYKTIDYQSLSAVLIEAVKEQQSQIDELKEKNELLNQKISELEKLKVEVEAIKAKLGL